MISIFLTLSFSIFVRYLVISVLIEKTAIKLGLKKVFTFRKKAGQRRHEIKLSFWSSIIFGGGFTLLYYLWEQGVIKLADSSYPIWYHPLSLALALFLHDTYYYWLHRAMHHKSTYKLFHKGHHESVEVSAWTSFSFDPLECVMQVLPFFVILYFIPLHLYSLILFLIIMSVLGVTNHLNYEFYPRVLTKVAPFNFLISPTHHALHHKEFNTNYGLYFTWWDKLAKTESKNY